MKITVFLPKPFCEMQQICLTVFERFPKHFQVQNCMEHRGWCGLLGASSSLSLLVHRGNRSPAGAEHCWRLPGSSARLRLASPLQLIRLSVSRCGYGIVFAAQTEVCFESISQW